jgi:hypothetical protein
LLVRKFGAMVETINMSWMDRTFLLFLCTVGLSLSASQASAMGHNYHTLLGDGPEVSLVRDANVTLMTTDFWESGALVWQLVTTNDMTRDAADNECSANAPHSSGDTIYFAVDASAAQTDNKLQKLMSMLQVAQLTGMQITIKGQSNTAGYAADCTYSNITHVYLRNTTF